MGSGKRGTPSAMVRIIRCVVRGIRIVGKRVTDCDVTVDLRVTDGAPHQQCHTLDGFVPCPVAEALGIPLFVKREHGPGEDCDIQLVCRFMSTPYTVLHLAPVEWQYGGALGPAPPVVAVRSDGIPFTKEGWEELDGFICDELEEGAYVSLTRPSENTSPYGWAFRKLPDLSKDLGLRVPEGLLVMPSGLKKAVELNRTLGVVTGRYVNGRVGVRFPEPHGVKFVRPEFLVREDGSPADREEEHRWR